MRKTMRIAALAFALCWLIPWGFAGEARAAGPQNAFLEAAKAYDDGRYAEAARLFGALALGEKGDGIANARLYANLANSLYLAGETGPAMLWRLRALRLSPDDPDILYDLEKTGKSLGYDGAHEPALAKAVFFLYGPLSPKALTLLAVAFDLLFFGLLAALRFGGRLDPRGRFNKALKGAAIAMGLCLLATGASAVYALFAVADGGQAVAYKGDAQVRSGKSPDAALLFTLREGEPARVVSSADGYVLLENGRGKLGYAPRADLGFVAGPFDRRDLGGVLQSETGKE